MVNQVQLVATALGGLGRYGDTYMVHAAEGETVVPMEVLNQSPILKKRLFKQMRKMGIDPERYIVGNQLNSLNPVTGQPEFFLKKIFKKAKETVQKVMPGESERLLPLLAAAIPGVGPWATAGLGAGIGALVDDDWKRGALQGAMLGTGGRYLASAPGVKGAFSTGAYDPSFGNIIPRLRGIPAALKDAGTGEGGLAKFGRTMNPFAKTGSTWFGPAEERSKLAQWGPAAAGILGLTGLAGSRDDKRKAGSLIDYDISNDPLSNLISGNQQYVDWLRALGLPIANQDIYQEEGMGLPVGAQGGIVQKFAEGSGPFGVLPFQEFKPDHDTFKGVAPPGEVATGPDEDAGPMTPMDPRYFTDEDDFKFNLEKLDPSPRSIIEMLEDMEILGFVKTEMIDKLIEKGVPVAQAISLVTKKQDFIDRYGGDRRKLENPRLENPIEQFFGSAEPPQEAIDVANGGIIQGYQAGGFPRRTGAISGPGTGTSDSVPAMLSDGEFVMTADAVRNAGGGDRRVGAQKMYSLMHRLEGGLV